MTKLERFKQAIKNPPPERLAAIEFRSHLLQGIGIAFASVLLIIKGLWYIVFAFVFGIGISYSQGMNAYMKWKTLVSMKVPEKAIEFEFDISPSRRRSKIVKYVMGDKIIWLHIVFSVALTIFIIPADISRWLLMLVYPISITGLFIFIHFFLTYWFANPIYQREMKGGKKNGKTKKRRN